MQQPIRVRQFFTSLILASCAASSVLAHPGHHAEQSAETSPRRVWHVQGRTAAGSATVQKEDRVQLESSAGVLWVEIRDLSEDDQAFLRNQRARIEQLNRHPLMLAQNSSDPRSAAPRDLPADVQTIYRAFAPFSDRLKLRWDERHFIVESNGLPAHGMMVGITNWQQQVPLPQPYTRENAWRIPLHPRLADKPISAKRNLFRGAIALAVNGVPIFNALNNRGEDALAIGELDEWGGHCGRADDYHYHAAPVHLQEIVGPGQPIAYALDGFPIYGLTEADGSPVGPLDEFNGQFDAQGNYHYHATKAYPYINGGLRGAVEVRGDQVEPQPRSVHTRPDGRPLRGAKITEFSSPAENQYRLVYTLGGTRHAIDYSIQGDRAEFRFTDDAGRTTSQSYTRRPEPPRGRGPGGDRPPPR
jgi:hypothetical protein